MKCEQGTNNWSWTPFSPSTDFGMEGAMTQLQPYRWGQLLEFVRAAIGKSSGPWMTYRAELHHQPRLAEPLHERKVNVYLVFLLKAVITVD